MIWTMKDGVFMWNSSVLVMFSGKDIVAVDSPVGRLGLSVCYDLRFPEMYQLLRFQHEAQVISGNITFLLKSVVCLQSKFSYVLQHSGTTGACSIHNSNRWSTLGDSSSCPCNWDSMLCKNSFLHLIILPFPFFSHASTIPGWMCLKYNHWIQHINILQKYVFWCIHAN